MEGFFKQYLTVPVILVFWIGGYLWKRAGWVSIKDMDIDTGRRELDWDAIRAHRAKVASWPAWRRVLHTVF